MPCVWDNKIFYTNAWNMKNILPMLKGMQSKENKGLEGISTVKWRMHQMIALRVEGGTKGKIEGVSGGELFFLSRNVHNWSTFQHIKATSMTKPSRDEYTCYSARIQIFNPSLSTNANVDLFDLCIHFADAYRCSIMLSWW